MEYTWWQVGYSGGCGCCDITVGKFATQELAEQAYPIVLEEEPVLDGNWYEIYQVKHVVQTAPKEEQ